MEKKDIRSTHTEYLGFVVIYIVATGCIIQYRIIIQLSDPVAAP